MYTMKINWEGWKQITVNLDQFGLNRSTESGWHDIQYIDLYATGWGMTPNPETVIYINSVCFESGAHKTLEEVDEELLNSLMAKSTCFYAGRNQYLDKNEVKKYGTAGSYELNEICYVPASEDITCLGKEVTVDEETMKAVVGGKKTDIDCIETNGVLYAPVADVAKELGKNVVTYKKLVVVSDDKSVAALKGKTKTLDDIASQATAYNVKPEEISKADMELTIKNGRIT